MIACARLAVADDLPEIRGMVRRFLVEDRAAGSSILASDDNVDYIVSQAKSVVRGTRVGAVALVPGGLGCAVVAVVDGPLRTDLEPQAIAWVIWVDPRHRREGLARAMHGVVLGRLRARGVRTLVSSAWTDDGHAAQRALWEGLGGRWSFVGGHLEV